MPLIVLSARHVLRTRLPHALRQRLCRASQIPLACAAPRRSLYDGAISLAVEEVVEDDKKRGDLKEYINEYKASFNVPKPNFQFTESIPISQIGQTVTAVGYVGKLRDISRAMLFVPLSGGPGLEHVQIFARSEINDEARKTLREIPENSAISVTGILGRKYEAKGPKRVRKTEEDHCSIDEVEIRAQSVTGLGTFPKGIKEHAQQQFESKYRHLQMRFDEGLRDRLKFRSKVAAFARNELSDFQEVETPILFRSTPEGAREFIVPTRRRGYAYGLPQSPQQYKQILMASGVQKYMQFAKCFRDEDHRADRQPEFTQIDLEMAWADGEDVMQRVERLMKALWSEFAAPGTVIPSPLPDTAFPRLTYDEAMSKHGSDKPDLRIQGLIHRIDHILPPNLRGMLTSIENPVIEACKICTKGDTPTVQKFIRDFLDSPDAEEFRNNDAGAPGVFVVDIRRPLEGLQAFGFEGAEALKSFYAKSQDTNTYFDEGDLLLLQARENLPHTGGATKFGKLRLAIHKAAVAQGLIEPDHGHHFLWVTDFPMFTLNDGSEPGQGGDSGFSATHHPFTAPKTAADVDMLLTDPLKAIADHYDLVLNGVELGGGSRRIHNAEMQKYVMREVLKINSKRMTDFSHLFLALHAGCPPHAGLAIGFDRLIAVMQGVDSVRDVIAFPKDKIGRDLMAHAPTQLSKKRMAEYHLQIKDEEAQLTEARARDIETRKTQALESLKELLDTITKLRGDPTDFESPGQEIMRNEVDCNSKDARVGKGYRPGELLPYAVMLYNQVGGKFLLDSLKGFEALIESLGKELGTTTSLDAEHSEAPSLEIAPKRKATFHPESATTQLERLHSEMRDEILSQLQSIERSHEPSSRKGLEVLELKLEEALEPVKLLYTSLKNLEPMIESLDSEVEEQLRKYKEPDSLKIQVVGDGQPFDLGSPSDRKNLSRGLPPSQ